MEPHLPLTLSPPRLVTSLPNKVDGTAASVVQLEPPVRTITTFPTSGHGSDTILNLAYERHMIDSQGRVMDPFFDLKDALCDEIKAAGTKLAYTYAGSGIQSKTPELPFIPLAFLPCIFELQKMLKEETPPEIIGGAVSYLLGESFYIAYAMKRLSLSVDEAKEMLSPLLEQIRKIPGDIDCRQYVKNEMHAAFLNRQELFKIKISQMIFEIAKKNNPALHGIDTKTIIDHYYQKLFLVSGNLKFGMARFGMFLGGAPLEYIIVPKALDRPYITFHKSLAIVVAPPHEPK